jgi:hypothetical protein
MTEGRVAPWIVRQIEGNLWAIFASGFAAFSAYLIGTTTTDHRLTALEGDVSKIEAKVDALSPRIDRAEVQLQFEREERLKADK